MTDETLNAASARKFRENRDTLRQALDFFILDPPDNDFQRGYHEALKELVGTLTIDVAELQPDEDSPGLWIGFKTSADRERAMQWFRALDDRGGEA